MIELFSVINQLEKGALGLFFEMNYFVGVALAGYISWFIHNFEDAIAEHQNSTEMDEKTKKDFSNMFNWLYFQYLYLYFCTLVAFGVWFVYKNMNNKAEAKIQENSNKEKKVSSKNDDEK